MRTIILASLRLITRPGLPAAALGRNLHTLRSTQRRLLLGSGGLRFLLWRLVILFLHFSQFLQLPEEVVLEIELP